MDSKSNDSHGHLSKLFKYPHFVRGVVAQFFYIGAQVGTWSYLIPYVKDYLQKPEKEAGYFLLASMILFAVGRILSTLIMRKVEPKLLMGIYSMVNVVLVIVAMTMASSIGGYALVLSSFFMSLMFPTIFASGLKGLGPNTKIGASMLVMAIIGGAVWTPVMGLISDKFDSLSLAMIIPLIGYLVVGIYAFKGSEPSGPLYDTDEKVIAGH
jgi:FHS family L-fucose permease-like MFS transporter